MGGGIVTLPALDWGTGCPDSPRIPFRRVTVVSGAWELRSSLCIPGQLTMASDATDGETEPDTLIPEVLKKNKAGQGLTIYFKYPG